MPLQSAAIAEPTFTIGIEEEYHLVDPVTRDLASDPPGEVMLALRADLGDSVTSEFLRSQVEIGTPVCASISQARVKLAELRAALIVTLDRFQLAPIAASTHPFARWSELQHTDTERYNTLARDLQVVVRRLATCGMHVHVGIEDDDLRIDIMNQARYFMPHLLALSTSSPFWQGQDTGLKSYRLSVFDELPRTGLPPQFDSFGEHERTIRVLVDAGLIEDASKIWWDLRAAVRFPTLEMRITDVCTRLDDAIAVAALFACLCRMLYRLRRSNQRWRGYSNFLVRENRWRAQRYGVRESLVDFGRGMLVPFADLVAEVSELIDEDAHVLGCTAEIAHLRDIVANGTSADRQLACFQALLDGGLDEDAALRGVVDHLVAETRGDVVVSA